MSAADVRIRADEVRHERTDARKTRWTAAPPACHGVRYSMFNVFLLLLTKAHQNDRVQMLLQNKIGCLTMSSNKADHPSPFFT